MHKLNLSLLDPSIKEVLPPIKKLNFLGDINAIDVLAKPKVAIVGTRKPTPYGKNITTKIARELIKHNIPIISGLALGIDSIAHRVSTEAKSQTIAILPCGLDRIYPASHYGLAQSILANNGLIISEYDNKTPIYKHNFIARNRIIAALADLVIIPEAAYKSGSLHTASFALELGKPVMAVPGPVNSAMSQGCNNLLKSGALLYTKEYDILDALNIHHPENTKKVHTAQLSANESIVANLLQSGITNGHELLEKSQLSSSEFSKTITVLEINGHIKSLGSNCWTLL